jgi:hypothetical protein
MPNDNDAVLEAIARLHLRVPTLAARKLRALDFHELGVWALRDALGAAFLAGVEATHVHVPARILPTAADALWQAIVSFLNAGAQLDAEARADEPGKDSAASKPQREFARQRDHLCVAFAQATGWLPHRVRTLEKHGVDQWELVPVDVQKIRPPTDT